DAFFVPAMSSPCETLFPRKSLHPRRIYFSKEWQFSFRPLGKIESTRLRNLSGELAAFVVFAALFLGSMQTRPRNSQKAGICTQVSCFQYVAGSKLAYPAENRNFTRQYISKKKSLVRPKPGRAAHPTRVAVLRLPDRRRQRAAPKQMLLDKWRHIAVNAIQFRQSAAHHDHIRIEQVDDAGHGPCDPLFESPQTRFRCCIACFRRAHDRFAGDA